MQGIRSPSFWFIQSETAPSLLRLGESTLFCQVLCPCEYGVAVEIWMHSLLLGVNSSAAVICRSQWGKRLVEAERGQWRNPNRSGFNPTSSAKLSNASGHLRSSGHQGWEIQETLAETK